MVRRGVNSVFVFSAYRIVQGRAAARVCGLHVRPAQDEDLRCVLVPGAACALQGSPPLQETVNCSAGEIVAQTDTGDA